jgi:3-methylcrotonyl-CoA carboxylase alpha subunit
MERIVFVYRGEKGPEEIVVERRGAFCSLARGGALERADLATLPDGRLSLVFEDGRQVSGRVAAADPGVVTVISRGVSRRLELAEPLRDRLAHAFLSDPGGGGEEQVRAPMPGRVVDVAVALGQTVSPGALLLVLEAMKMQNEIRSEHGGTVVRLDVEKGRVVESGALLVTLEAKSQ